VKVEVSEEHIAFIFRVEEYGEQDTGLKHAASRAANEWAPTGRLRNSLDQ
jgi:hypothetical protein